jgi:hypothetical protein
MLRDISWVLAAALLVACGSDDSGGGGGTGGGATGGSAGQATGGSSTGGSSTGGSSTGGSSTGGAAGQATGGSAGAATGGSGGTGGAAGASGGAAGSGGGQACNWGGVLACPSGQYCNAPGCGAGTCVPIPAETDEKAPACGCDGVTYWNAKVAGHASISVKSSGVCTTGGKACGGLGGFKCPTGTFCNYGVSSSAMCNVADLGGVCWGMPATCPQILIGPQTRACKASTCTSECELIKAGSVWYSDNTCPT